MRRLFEVLISTIPVTNMVVMAAMAAPYNPDKSTPVNTESELLALQIRSSRVTELPRPRGVFFSATDSTIFDEGNGDVGVFAKVYMEILADEACITVYLGQQDEDTERWRQVAFYDAEFYLKDYPNGIIGPEVNMIFRNQPKEYYCRLGGVSETVLNRRFGRFSPTTAGILAK